MLFMIPEFVAVRDIQSTSNRGIILLSKILYAVFIAMTTCKKCCSKCDNTTPFKTTDTGINRYIITSVLLTIIILKVTPFNGITNTSI